MRCHWVSFAALPASALIIYMAFTLGCSQKTENAFSVAETLKVPETIQSQSNGNRPIETAIVKQNSDKQNFYCKDRETLKIWKALKKTKYVIDQLQGEIETDDRKDYIETIKNNYLKNDGQKEL